MEYFKQEYFFGHPCKWIHFNSQMDVVRYLFPFMSPLGTIWLTICLGDFCINTSCKDHQHGSGDCKNRSLHKVLLFRYWDWEGWLPSGVYLQLPVAFINFTLKGFVVPWGLETKRLCLNVSLTSPGKLIWWLTSLKFL